MRRDTRRGSSGDFTVPLSFFKETGSLFFSLAVLLVLVAAPRGILDYALLGWDRMRSWGVPAPHPAGRRQVADGSTPPGLGRCRQAHGSVRAVSAVSLTLYADELRGLVGPNAPTRPLWWT